MEEFKKKIKFRFQLCTMYMCSGTMLYFLLSRFTENVPDFSRGMLAGLLVGGDLLAVFYMIRCFVLLHDEKKLKEAYIKSADERNKEISKETMRTASVISLLCTGLAIIITGFFSKTVSITLFLDMTAGVLITVFVNLYYNKKCEFVKEEHYGEFQKTTCNKQLHLLAFYSSFDNRSSSCRCI